MNLRLPFLLIDSPGHQPNPIIIMPSPTVRLAFPKNATLKNPKFRSRSRAITDIETRFVTLVLTGRGAKWDRKTALVTPPANWFHATADIAGFALAFTNDDHNVIQLGIDCSLEAAPNNRIQVKVQSIIRDRNADDPRRADIVVKILYHIASDI
jgi:hypothetical protein